MNRKRVGRTRKRHRQKFISGLLVLLLVIIFGMSVNNNFVQAGDDHKSTELQHEKYYKCIMLEYGDTLWEIALRYKGSHYESVNDYIDEVMMINHLKTDKIHAGRYLTVPYYSDSDNYNEISTKTEAKAVGGIKKNY